MADYYPLLARALDALPDRTAPMRKAVYERARNALIGQLRSLEPPLSEADIDLERQALDAAIQRLEVDYGTPGDLAAAPAAAPAAAAVAKPPPPSIPPTPVVAKPGEPEPKPEAIPVVAAEPGRMADPVLMTDPVSEAAPTRDAKPFLPPAPSPSFLPDPAPVEPAREPAVSITARKAKEPEAERATLVEAPAEAVSDTVAANDAANGRQRPRIDVVAPRGSRSRLLRNTFVGIVLATVIGMIAVAAFLLRDKSANLQPASSETAEAQQDGAETKFADRIGSEPPPKAAPGPSQPEPRAPAKAAGPADLTVAQRAVLMEENTGGPNATPISTAGRVVWRLDSVAGEQGQPLETAIVANVTFAEAGLSLTMTIQRNLDQTLPASHTINLAFTPMGPEGEKRSVQDIGLLQAKDEETGRGSPLSGLPVPVQKNLFLIGLSSLRSDVERNTDLLLHKSWFDITIRYSSGQRAVMTFEKGNAGTQVIEQAFDQWH